jgi:outer membrane lipoprotein SlyB
MNPSILMVFAALALGACASNQPVVYQSSGASGGVEAAIAECKQLAANAGAQANTGLGTATRRTAEGAAVGAATGAIGGAIAGSAATGAGIGAATGAAANLLRTMFDEPAPSPAFRGYVERCLKERGYDVVGWQ